MFELDTYLKNKNPLSSKVSDKDDNVVLGETCCTDSEGTSSDSDSVGVNQSDSSVTGLSSSPCS